MTQHFQKRTEIFLSRLKAQWEKSGGRILLGDNTGGGKFMLRPISLQCAGIWISAGPPFTYIKLAVCAINSKLHRIFRNVNIVEIGQYLYKKCISLLQTVRGQVSLLSVVYCCAATGTAVWCNRPAECIWWPGKSSDIQMWSSGGSICLWCTNEENDSASATSQGHPC